MPGAMHTHAVSDGLTYEPQSYLTAFTMPSTQNDYGSL